MIKPPDQLVSIDSVGSSSSTRNDIVNCIIYLDR